MGPEELQVNVGELNQILQLIMFDLQEYSIFDANGMLVINECDVRHLNLEPFEVQKATEDIPLGDTFLLPRALKLCTHVLIALTYKKNMNLYNELKGIVQLSAYWRPEYRKEFVRVIETMLFLEEKTWAELRKFCLSFEQASKSRHWIKDNLHLSWGRVLQNANTAVLKKEVEGLGPQKKLENLAEFMCNDCKNLDIKSDNIINNMSQHFCTILSEYYKNPELAETEEAFIKAREKCKDILKGIGLSFKCMITPLYVDLFGYNPQNFRYFTKLNKTFYFFCDLSRYPDENNLVVQLKLSIGKVCCSDLVDEEKDLCLPVNNSVIGAFIRTFNYGNSLWHPELSPEEYHGLRQLLNKIRYKV